MYASIFASSTDPSLLLARRNTTRAKKKGTTTSLDDTRTVIGRPPAMLGHDTKKGTRDTQRKRAVQAMVALRYSEGCLARLCTSLLQVASR